MPTQQTTLLSPTELAYLHSSLSLSPPLRPDARSPTTFRPLIAETDLLPSTNGSARVCFADGTEGIVGIKADIQKTVPASTGRNEAPKDSEDNDVPMDCGAAPSSGLKGEEDIAGSHHGEHDWVDVTIDMPGQRDDESTVVFLAQMIHEGLVADGTLPAKLYINRRWHWKLYIDILLLSPPSSYPLPLLSLSTHLALLSSRLPAPISQGDEDPLFNDDWDAALPLYPPYPATSKGKSKEAPTASMPNSSASSKAPITLLIASVGDNVFFDPSREELAVADAVLAVTITSTPPPPSSSVVPDQAPGTIKILAIRTIDPPARLSTSSSAALGGEPGFGAEEGKEVGDGWWKPVRGGMKRKMLGKMLEMCVKPGGVGEEVLRGLEGFV